MQNSSAKVHSQASKRSSQQWRETQSMPSHGTEPSLQMQQNLKMLKCWFLLWRQWQKRIAVCRLLQQCSTSQLECLATALEPVLHLDFANSLSPLGAALHQEGSQTFYVQRAFRQPLQAVEAEKERLAVKTRGNLTLPNPTTISLEDEEGKTLDLQYSSLGCPSFIPITKCQYPLKQSTLRNGKERLLMCLPSNGNWILFLTSDQPLLYCRERDTMETMELGDRERPNLLLSLVEKRTRNAVQKSTRNNLL